MRLLVAGHKERGALCLEALVQAGHQVVGALAHHGCSDESPFASTALRLRLPLLRLENVNVEASLASLEALSPELIVLAGFGPIVSPDFIDLAPRGCINLHGGSLPEMRGSSPMNWALIHGHERFGISIIRVEPGVDTGDVLAEQEYPIGREETVADLAQRANEVFPDLLVRAVEGISRGDLTGRRQKASEATYYPLRFPDDGFVLWDQMDAEEIHNMVRALTRPFPGAFTYCGSQRLNLWSSKLAHMKLKGVPGRIYLINSNGLLVAARDRALWINEVRDEDGRDAMPQLKRYDALSTVRGAVLDFHRRGQT